MEMNKMSKYEACAIIIIAVCALRKWEVAKIHKVLGLEVFLFYPQHHGLKIYTRDQRMLKHDKEMKTISPFSICISKHISSILKYAWCGVEILTYTWYIYLYLSIYLQY